jgi:hypothetical protein
MKRRQSKKRLTVTLDNGTWPLKGPPEPYPKRDEQYDRPVLRRR